MSQKALEFAPWLAQFNAARFSKISEDKDGIYQGSDTFGYTFDGHYIDLGERPRNLEDAYRMMWAHQQAELDQLTKVVLAPGFAAVVSWLQISIP